MYFLNQKNQNIIYNIKYTNNSKQHLFKGVSKKFRPSSIVRPHNKLKKGHLLLFVQHTLFIFKQITLFICPSFLLQLILYFNSAQYSDDLVISMPPDLNLEISVISSQFFLPNFFVVFLLKSPQAMAENGNKSTSKSNLDTSRNNIKTIMVEHIDFLLCYCIALSSDKAEHSPMYLFLLIFKYYFN